MKTIRSFSHRAITKLVSLTLLCLLSACSNADDKEAGSSTSFTLKDWLCATTPERCYKPAYEKVFTAPPDTIYERTLSGTRLAIPMGYVDPIDAIRGDDPTKIEIYLNAFGKDLQPRTPENITEFVRNGGHPGLVDFQVVKLRPDLDYQSWWLGEIIQEAVNKHLQDFDAIKRYPDKDGLEHWGNDYERAPRTKPCELPGEAKPCGTYVQQDLYRPLRPNGPPSYMKCDSWLTLKASTAPKTLAMTQAERDAYFDSGQDDADRTAAPWRMIIEPHCRHYMYYAPLHAEVVFRYHLALLPHWKQIEDRARAIVDAALRAPNTGTNTAH